ncbi:hypothetical protein, partial [Xanthomonas oryzae]|uniref:hypothetical protein n=2 Tax=Xanthomonas oryzae TaxID=347 RepID=UPI000DDE6CDB
TAHVTWIVLLAHSWSLHGLNKIVNRFLQTSAAMAPGGPHDGRRFNGAVAGLRSPNITLQRIG